MELLTNFFTQKTQFSLLLYISCRRYSEIVSGQNDTVSRLIVDHVLTSLYIEGTVASTKFSKLERSYQKQKELYLLRQRHSIT